MDKKNVIVAGHTRYKAARKLNLEYVPCVIADDLTDEQIKAYRLADNKVGELAEWDFDSLADELADIAELDMSDFGFDIDMSIENQEEDDRDPSFQHNVFENQERIGDKTGAEAVAAHEIGHRLGEIAARKAGISEQEVVSRAAKKVNIKTANMAGHISGYARSNYSETIAEASADVFCNGSKASKASRAIMNEIKAILR